MSTLRSWSIQPAISYSSGNVKVNGCQRYGYCTSFHTFCRCFKLTKVSGTEILRMTLMNFLKLKKTLDFIGAIRFVLSGAQIMCPGLTSKGACMNKVDKGTVVAIMAEGKQHALAIGFTTLSSDDMYGYKKEYSIFIYFIAIVNFHSFFHQRSKVNKGVGVENCHYLNDGLWGMKPVK